LGPSTDLAAGDLRWLSPLPLWTGILAGPIAWAFDLTVSYALVKWSCSSERQEVFHLITAAALLLVCTGALVSWSALRHSAGAGPTDGGQPRQRARFMAMLGLTMSALFALTILANAISYWVLDACR
jgi:hypothetical protein